MGTLAIVSSKALPLAVMAEGQIRGACLTLTTCHLTLTLEHRILTALPALEPVPERVLREVPHKSVSMY
jgi:hypothetical protein